MSSHSTADATSVLRSLKSLSQELETETSVASGKKYTEFLCYHITMNEWCHNSAL